MPRQDAAARSSTLKESRQQKFDQWFKDRKWRVAAEISGTREQDGNTFRYHKGYFQIDRPGVFQTPLGHKGRAGYMLHEVDADGSDIPDSLAAFGRIALESAIKAYGSVTGLPDRDPRRRGGAWVT